MTCGQYCKCGGRPVYVQDINKTYDLVKSTVKVAIAAENPNTCYDYILQDHFSDCDGCYNTICDTSSNSTYDSTNCWYSNLCVCSLLTVHCELVNATCVSNTPFCMYACAYSTCGGATCYGVTNGCYNSACGNICLCLYDYVDACYCNCLGGNPGGSSVCYCNIINICVEPTINYCCVRCACSGYSDSFKIEFCRAGATDCYDVYCDGICCGQICHSAYCHCYYTYAKIFNINSGLKCTKVAHISISYDVKLIGCVRNICVKSNDFGFCPKNMLLTTNDCTGSDTCIRYDDFDTATSCNLGCDLILNTVQKIVQCSSCINVNIKQCGTAPSCIMAYGYHVK